MSYSEYEIIKLWIEKAELEKAFENLKMYGKERHKDFSKDITMLNSRFERLKKKEQNRTISGSEANITKNQIIDDTLFLISKIESTNKNFRAKTTDQSFERKFSSLLFQKYKIHIAFTVLAIFLLSTYLIYTLNYPLPQRTVRESPVILFGSGTVAAFLTDLFASDSLYDNSNHILLGGSTGAVDILLPTAFHNDLENYPIVPLLGMASDSISHDKLKIPNFADKSNLTFFKTQVGTSSLKITIGSTDEKNPVNVFFKPLINENETVSKELFVMTLKHYIKKTDSLNNIRIFITTKHSATRKRYSKILGMDLDSLEEKRDNIRSFSRNANETDKVISSKPTPWIVLGNEYYYLPADKFSAGVAKEIEIKDTEAKLYLYGRLFNSEGGVHNLSYYCDFFQLLHQKLNQKLENEPKLHNRYSFLEEEKSFLNLDTLRNGGCKCEIEYKSVLVNDRFANKE